MRAVRMLYGLTPHEEFKAGVLFCLVKQCAKSRINRDGAGVLQRWNQFLNLRIEEAQITPLFFTAGPSNPPDGRRVTTFGLWLRSCA